MNWIMQTTIHIPMQNAVHLNIRAQTFAALKISVRVPMSINS
jgi:hypothetical protein